MIRLIVLDMDGVVFARPNFWLDVHVAMGTVEQGLDLWRRLAKRDYPEMSRQTAELWRGRSASAYLRLVAEREFVPDIAHIPAFARARGIKTAIVSSGSWHLAQRARRELGIDIARANRLGIDRSRRFDGDLDLQVDDNHKDVAVGLVQDRLGVHPQETVVIGDSASDVAMLARAAFGVGYRVDDDKARAAFRVSIDSGSIARAISAIDEHALVA